MLYIELPTEGVLCRARIPTDFGRSVSWIAKGKGTIHMLFRLEHGRALAIPQTTPEKPTGNQDEFNAALRSEDETRRVSAALTMSSGSLLGNALSLPPSVAAHVTGGPLPGVAWAWGFEDQLELWNDATRAARTNDAIDYLAP